MINRFLFLLILVLSAVACKTIKPPPPTNMNESAAVKSIPVILSRIDVPVAIKMTPFIEMANKEIPKKYNGSETPCEGLRYEYNVKLGEFDLDGRGANKVAMDMEFAYTAKGVYCAYCFGESCTVPTIGFNIGTKDNMKRATLAIESRIDLMPNYHLKTNTEIKEIVPIDPIKKVFGYDITNLLLKQVKPYLGEATKIVDQEINKIDLKEYIQPAYDELQKDIFIDGVGYLALFPKEISVSKLTFNKDKLNVSLGLKAAPTLKSTPFNVTPEKLPNLTKYKKSEGFELYTDLKIDYDTLSKQIMYYLKKEVFEVGRNKIMVNNLKLFSAGEKLGVQVDFIGTKSGTIYLVAKPVFDANNQQMRVDDLEYDLSTKNLLLKSAKWLLNETIRKKMQDAMTYDLKKDLDDAKRAVNKSLNSEISKGVVLKGGLEDIQVVEFQTQPKELFARIRMDGDISVLLKDI